MTRRKDRDLIKEAAANWPFGAFWAALNQELVKHSRPETNYKGALEAWNTAKDIALMNPIERGDLGYAETRRAHEVVSSAASTRKQMKVG